MLALLPTHLTYQRMGRELGVSRNTVKTHVVRVYRKLGVSCRAEAVGRAEALGVLPVP